MDLILFGMQGSGKGTQGKFIAEKLGMKVFDTGAALREIVASGTPLGDRVKEIINAGKHVDSETVMNVVAAFLEDVPQETPILFDGIPRNAANFAAFEPLMASHGRSAQALLLKISREEAMGRLTARKTCAKCKTVYGPEAGETCSLCGGELIVRADDVPDAIRKRLDIFQSETVPVIEEYRKQGRLIEVNGMRPVAEVTAEILSLVS